MCTYTPPSAAADAADESGTSALDSSTNTSSGGSGGGGGGGFFSGLGLGSFGLGGDLLEEEEGDEGEEEGDMDDDYTGGGEGLWAGLLGGGGGGGGGGGSVEARYNVGHWQALYEGLQQARHPRYYDEVRSGTCVLCGGVLLCVDGLFGPDWSSHPIPNRSNQTNPNPHRQPHCTPTIKNHTRDLI